MATRAPRQSAPTAGQLQASKKKKRLLDTDYSSDSGDTSSSESSEISYWPRYDPKKQQKIKDNNEKIRNWLKTKSSVQQLLSKYETNKHKQNNVLLECTNQIIDSVFDGLHNILYFLIDNASNTQLKQIHQIIKSINKANKAKPKPNSIQKPMAMEVDNNQKTKPEINLNTASSVSISYICGFLDRDSFENFRLVSRKIAIICLEEMLKFTVGIFNMNEVVLFNDFYKNEKIVDFDTMLKEHRHHPNRNVTQLQEQWSKHYGINIENQILYPNWDMNGYGMPGMAASGLQRFQNVIHPHQKIINFGHYTQFYLFDTANIVYINNKNQPKNILNNVNNDNLGNGNCLLILKYFDLWKQTVQCIQFVIIHKSITYNNIIQYLQSQFVCKNKQQAIFYENFKENIKKMQFVSTNEPMIQIYHRIVDDYELIWSEVDDTIKSKPICSLFKYNSMKEITFQLNSKHEYIANNFTITYDDYISFEEYLRDLETIRVNSCVKIDELKLMIKSFTGGQVAKYVNDFDEQHDGKLYENLEGNVTCGQLRQMISNDISNGTINAPNIEIIELIREEIFLCPWNDGFDGDNEFRFTLVPYDVTTVNHSTQNIYNVKIFLPKHCPLPFFEPDNVTTNVMILYNKQFLVKDFTDYIFDVIIQKPLYKKQLKHIYDIYNENKNDLNLIFARHHESKGYCQIMKEYKEEQKGNDDIEYPKQVEIDLYLLMRPKMYKNMKLITIRFIKCGLQKSQFVRNKKYNDMKHSFFVGLPLEIWLNENDSNCLKDIIQNNMYFDKYKDYIDIHTVFRIGDNDEIVSFSIEDAVLSNDMILFGTFDTNDSETVFKVVYV